MFKINRRQSGIGAIEFLIALPLLIALGLTAWQWALVLQARQLLEHAAHEAVRSGARGQASVSSIDQGLARGLTAFWPFVPGDDTDARSERALDRLHDARAENWMDWRQLSPTRQSFSDWAEPAIDPAGRALEGVLEIPIDNLDARIVHTQPASGVSAWLGSEPIGTASAQTLRDAGVLRIELHVALPLRVPIAGRLIAAASGWPQSCRPPCLFVGRAGANDDTARILLRVHAEARMQSPARLTARTPDRTQSVSSSTAMSSAPPEGGVRRPIPGVDPDPDLSGAAVMQLPQASTGTQARAEPRMASASADSASADGASVDKDSSDGASMIGGAPGGTSGQSPDQGPLQASEIRGEIWSPGACGIAPG